MTLDKFGRNLTHPYHLAKKLKTEDGVKDKPENNLYGYMNIMLVCEKGLSKHLFINGTKFDYYRFPITSGIIEYVNIDTPVKTYINATAYEKPSELLHQKLNLNDHILFLGDKIRPRTKIYVEFIIKYPIL
jgi:hypothetical protein